MVVQILVEMTAQYQMKNRRRLMKLLVGFADGIWSEVVLSGEEKTWRKGSDAVNVCNFGGTVG